MYQRAEPGRSAPAGSVVLYRLETTNHGSGRASRVRLLFRYDARLAELLDVRLEHSGAWVTRADPGEVEISLGSLPPREGRADALIRLAIGDDIQAGSQLQTTVEVIWEDGARPGNSLTIVVGPRVEGERPARLEVAPASGPPGTSFRFSSGPLFIPDEPLALWYDTPEGDAIELGRSEADEAGAVALRLDSAGLAPGSYQLVVHGVWSGVEATGPFEVSGD